MSADRQHPCPPAALHLPPSSWWPVTSREHPFAIRNISQSTGCDISQGPGAGWGAQHGRGESASVGVVKACALFLVSFHGCTLVLLSSLIRRECDRKTVTSSGTLRTGHPSRTGFLLVPLLMGRSLRYAVLPRPGPGVETVGWPSVGAVGHRLGQVGFGRAPQPTPSRPQPTPD